MTGMDLFGEVSTVDDGARSEFDFYETPSFMTLSLLHFHPAIRASYVLECCSGRDAIANVLRRSGNCEVATNDLDPRHPAMTHGDARLASYWADAPPAEWVITNPPFNDAFAIIVHALQHASVGVAFLLRKTWREPTIERGPWLGKNPPVREIGQPRYSFRGESSDSCAADWMIWEHRPDRSLPPIVVDYMAASRRSLC